MRRSISKLACSLTWVLTGACSTDAKLLSAQLPQDARLSSLSSQQRALLCANDLGPVKGFGAEETKRRECLLGALLSVEYEPPGLLVAECEKAYSDCVSGVAGSPKALSPGCGSELRDCGATVQEWRACSQAMTKTAIELLAGHDCSYEVHNGASEMPAPSSIALPECETFTTHCQNLASSPAPYQPECTFVLDTDGAVPASVDGQMLECGGSRPGTNSEAMLQFSLGDAALKSVELAFLPPKEPATVPIKVTVRGTDPDQSWQTDDGACTAFVELSACTQDTKPGVGYFFIAGLCKGAAHPLAPGSGAELQILSFSGASACVTAMPTASQ